MWGRCRGQNSKKFTKISLKRSLLSKCVSSSVIVCFRPYIHKDMLCFEFFWGFSFREALDLSCTSINILSLYDWQNHNKINSYHCAGTVGCCTRCARFIVSVVASAFLAGRDGSQKSHLFLWFLRFSKNYDLANEERDSILIIKNGILYGRD